MGLFDAIKNLFGEKSEKEAEEIIELANDPEGDEWNDHFPVTPHPGTDTPDEFEIVNPPDPPANKESSGFLSWLFGR